jgi:hypothetical protein
VLLQVCQCCCGRQQSQESRQGINFRLMKIHCLAAHCHRTRAGARLQQWNFAKTPARLTSGLTQTVANTSIEYGCKTFQCEQSNRGSHMTQQTLDGSCSSKIPHCPGPGRSACAEQSSIRHKQRDSTRPSTTLCMPPSQLKPIMAGHICLVSPCCPASFHEAAQLLPSRVRCASRTWPTGSHQRRCSIQVHYNVPASRSGWHVTNRASRSTAGIMQCYSRCGMLVTMRRSHPNTCAEVTEYSFSQ